MFMTQRNSFRPIAPTFSPVRSGILQRDCSCGGKCEDCKKKTLQRRPAGGHETGTVPPIVHEVLRSSGQPLDRETRAFMEPRFGHDFSKVRLHTDERAKESARSVHAHAYTVGNDIAFASGAYQPQTSSGQRLLAHELTHVVQQRGATSSGSLSLGAHDSPAEKEAEAAANSMAVGTDPAAP